MNYDLVKKQYNLINSSTSTKEEKKFILKYLINIKENFALKELFEDLLETILESE